MLRLRVEEMLREQGRTKYWLNKQLGMGYSAFDRMVKNKTKMIKFENIEALCRILDCTPNDLFEITDD